MARSKKVVENSEKTVEERKFITYKGKKLIRTGNLIYYGDPKDKYIVCYKIEKSEPFAGIDISTDLIVELLLNKTGDKKLIKQARRESLFKAMDIGTFWLEDALENF